MNVSIPVLALKFGWFRCAQQLKETVAAQLSVSPGVVFDLGISWQMESKSIQKRTFPSTSQEKHYLIMVPFTLCAFTVGLDLVNQSLSTLTAAPMAMTAIQAGFMSAATMLWTVGCHVYMLIARIRSNEAPPPLVKSRSGERSPSRVPSELTLYLDAGQLPTFTLPSTCGVP